MHFKNSQVQDTPANKIATAQATLGLAVRLNGEVNAGGININIYKKDVTVITGGKGLVLPASPQSTIYDLENGIINILLIALSASALTLDETLDEVYGKKSEDDGMGIFGLRVMINQLRNAFAHNPWRPRWLIFEKYRRAFDIDLSDGSKFTFDATDLDGQTVKPEHVGGLEFWVKVLQHCEQLVKNV